MPAAWFSKETRRHVQTAERHHSNLLWMPPDGFDYAELCLADGSGHHFGLISVLDLMEVIHLGVHPGCVVGKDNLVTANGRIGCESGLGKKDSARQK
jgi:hypothetical protein